jgi:hypothetical protein
MGRRVTRSGISTISKILPGLTPAGFSTVSMNASEAVLNLLGLKMVLVGDILVTLDSAGSSWLMSSMMLSMRGLTAAVWTAASPPTKGSS